MLIGLSLGALGGGGSILTVPALVYLLGQDPRAATTGSLLIVGVTAVAGMAAHHRAGRVRVVQGLVFGVLGIAGAYVGSMLSARVAPAVLLAAFSVLMLVVAAMMVVRRRAQRRTAAGDQALIPGTLEAAASGPQVTEGNLPGSMFSREAQAIREGRVSKPAHQTSIFGDETGAVRFRGRERVKIKATGEVGAVSKFNEDGSISLDTPSGKKKVRPEEVSFLDPEPLRPREAPPAKESARPRTVDTEAPRTSTDPAEKLMELVEAGKGAITKTKRARTIEIRRRSKEFRGRLEAGSGEEGARAARAALVGEMPQVREALAKADFTQQDIGGLFDRVRDSHLMALDQATAQDGLWKLLDGNVPQRSELNQLQRVFGKKFVDTVAQNPAWRRHIAEVVNLPRALAASFDMSAPLRQGLILSVSHPVRAAKAFGSMHRYFFSSKHFEEFADALRADQYLPLARESGLHLASIQSGAKRSLVHGEEIFRSTLAERLPFGIGRGVKASERAYLGYLDKLRMDVFKDSAKRLQKLGLDDVKNIDAYQDLAKWINIASGRGSLGRLERSMDALGQGFFAPRFWAARLQTPFAWIKMHPAVRKQYAREMASLAGVGLGVTALAGAAGADIETDMRHTDFGKLRVGHTRVDISGGFQPHVRFVAQIAGGLPWTHTYERKGKRVYDLGPVWKTGARKTMSGEIKPLTGTGPFPESRLSTIGKYVSSKTSPPVRLLIELLEGKDMMGDPLEWGGNVAAAAKRGASADEIVREITKTKTWEMFVPMFLQDMTEAIQEEGLVGGALALPAGYGVGVGTYPTPEEAWAKTKRRAKLRAIDPNELLRFSGARKVER